MYSENSPKSEEEPWVPEHIAVNLPPEKNIPEDLCNIPAIDPHTDFLYPRRALELRGHKQLVCEIDVLEILEYTKQFTCA